jgi:hypothetical protein
VALDPNSGEAIVSRHRFEGGTETLGRLQSDDNELAVAWAGPGDAIAVNGSSTALRIEGGIPRVQAVTVEGAEIFVAMVIFHPSRGYILGSYNNLALIENGLGGFQYLASFESSSQRLDSILPYEDGLVIGERNGTFRRYHDEVGYCPAQRGFGGEPLNFLVAGAHGELFGGNSRLYYAVLPENACAR